MVRLTAKGSVIVLLIDMLFPVASSTNQLTYTRVCVVYVRVVVHS
jgi:hypothetical protein